MFWSSSLGRGQLSDRKKTFCYCYMDPLLTTRTPLQPSDFGEKLVERKESARHALRQTSSQELHELVRTLFPDGTHPWAAEF